MKKFKKKSILFISLGLAIATIAFAGPINPPGEPGKPKATDWGKDFCKLEWTKPSHDGGAPIASYDIEKNDLFFWRGCGTVPGTNLTGTVINLVEGNTYKFRVIACNIAGKGEPSDPSAPIITKER